MADGLGAAQLGVQVVIDPSHLSDSYPVLAFERQSEGPPAQVGRHVQNETSHVGELDVADVPEERQRLEQEDEGGATTSDFKLITEY